MGIAIVETIKLGFENVCFAHELQNYILWITNRQTAAPAAAAEFSVGNENSWIGEM